MSTQEVVRRLSDISSEAFNQNLSYQQMIDKLETLQEEGGEPVKELKEYLESQYVISELLEFETQVKRELAMRDFAINCINDLCALLSKKAAR